MHYVIVGNGITGITAARTLRKSDDSCTITIISSETKYFFSRTALMYIYMGHMSFKQTKPYEDSFWAKNRLELLQDTVVSVDFANKSLNLQGHPAVTYDKLLLACGSKPNMFNWPGQELPGVQGLYSYQDLELLEKNTHKAGTSASKQRVKKAVIVGGGLIGVELAEMLITRNIHVTFLIREKQFWGSVLPIEEASLVLNHLKNHGVDFIMSDELKEIKADENGHTSEVITSKGVKVPCQLVGLTVGVSPNIDFLKDSSINIKRGILVERDLKTNVKDVYSAGDCAEFIDPPFGRRPIEQVWYTGRTMGEIAAWNMLGEEVKYTPGPWFNSAKFFDLEYQTYGVVSNLLNENERQFYWESENGEKCIKIVFDFTSEQLIGVNVFGIRLRHEVLDKMLKEKESVNCLMENLIRANFDPEFANDYSDEIINKYNREFNKTIKLKRKKWLNQLWV